MPTKSNTTITVEFEVVEDALYAHATYGGKRIASSSGNTEAPFALGSLRLEVKRAVHALSEIPRDFLTSAAQLRLIELLEVNAILNGSFDNEKEDLGE